MLAIQWHDGLNVGLEFMDHDHAEAAALINEMASATGEARAAALERFIAHCREHFAREEAMMGKIGFFALGCHQGEHERVLAELDGVMTKMRAGEAQDHYFAKVLPEWLLTHRGTMDAVTAQFARSAGFIG